MRVVLMSRFKNLSKDRNTIMMSLLESQDICKALFYGRSDFLDQPNLDDPTKLIYKNIFPYRYVPNTTTEKSTFITLWFGKYRLVRNSFKSGMVMFNVFTHNDLHRTDYGVLRCDFIVNIIDEIVNSKYGIGVFKPEFYEADDLYVNKEYSGFYVAYKIHEWN